MEMGSMFGKAFQWGKTAYQFYKAREMQKKADAAKPNYVDQNEASFLNDIQMRRKNIDTGVGYATAEKKADEYTADTQNNILKAGGGDVQATLQGLLSAQRAGADQYNQGAYTGALTQQNYYTGLANSLVQKIADRKMQLQLADRAQYMAQAAQTRQDANANLNGLVGGGGGGMGGGSSSGGDSGSGGGGGFMSMFSGMFNKGGSGGGMGGGSGMGGGASAGTSN